MKIPAFDELSAIVKPRAVAVVPPLEGDDHPGLSSNAELFLRHAANATSCDLNLEDRWNRLGISSGSNKEKILRELTGRGFIRLEDLGRQKVVRLYPAAWDYLGITRPAGRGVGGDTHQLIAQYLMQRFKSQGYQVHIEAEIGLIRKRADLLALGKRRIAVEIGLSSAAQEVKNLRMDLRSAAIDLVLFIAIDKKMLDEVKKRASEDALLHRNKHRIHYRFLRLTEIL